MSELHNATVEFVAHRDRLLQFFPELANDPECLADTVEGETRLDLKGACVHQIRKALEDERTAKAAVEFARDVSARAKRLKDRSDRIKGAVLTAMQDAGLKKIEDAVCTISVANGQRSLVVTDATKIPEKYLRRVDPEPDKNAIKDAIKAGEDVPGCTLSNGQPHLTVRVA